MKGKVVVITGATSGIGEVAAARLAEMGARIVLVARDLTRGQEMLARLTAAGGSAHCVYYGDLSLIAETKRVAAQIAAAEPRVDVLINNAGALFSSREMTVDNLERTLCDQLHGLLRSLSLRASLLAAAPARVVSTASAAHKGYTLAFDDLQSAKGFTAMRGYGRCAWPRPSQFPRKGRADHRLLGFVCRCRQ